MFSKGLFIIIVPCLAILILIFWAWFPFWVFVKAYRMILGINPPEDSPTPIYAKEDDPAESVQTPVIRQPVIQKPVVKPTAFDPEFFQNNNFLKFDPKEAKRRLVFKNMAEKEEYKARKRHKEHSDEVEIRAPQEEVENSGSRGAQRTDNHSSDVRDVQKPEAAVASNQEIDP
ncbi:hypothetical protein VM1G_07116 [Cytospora mali]|uniref:Uncharacterized protein n=1 Tax=Cytospora mali TaxID=578113 RepID=A0A194W5H3_CYTMA|nr:hypothetical protein VM1G_07116 [Valsa mali]